MSPLHYACLYGHLDCVQLLLEEQADINAMSQRHMYAHVHNYHSIYQLMPLYTVGVVFI